MQQDEGCPQGSLLPPVAMMTTDTAHHFKRSLNVLHMDLVTIGEVGHSYQAQLLSCFPSPFQYLGADTVAHKVTRRRVHLERNENIGELR